MNADTTPAAATALLHLQFKYVNIKKQGQQCVTFEPFVGINK
jgi:hypothetical protein